MPPHLSTHCVGRPQRLSDLGLLRPSKPSRTRPPALNPARTCLVRLTLMSLTSFDLLILSLSSSAALSLRRSTRPLTLYLSVSLASSPCRYPFSFANFLPLFFDFYVLNCIIPLHMRASLFTFSSFSCSYPYIIIPLQPLSQICAPPSSARTVCT